jgi:AsmA protein
VAIFSGRATGGKEGRLTLPLLIGGTLEAPSYGLDMKGLTGKVQEQIKQKAEEAIGGLLKGTTKPKIWAEEAAALGLFSR